MKEREQSVENNITEKQLVKDISPQLPKLQRKGNSKENWERTDSPRMVNQHLCPEKERTI